MIYAQLLTILAQTAEAGAAAASTAAKAAPTPPPGPTGIGTVDWILIVIVLIGVWRGYTTGLTGELWSLLGTFVVVGGSFLFYSTVADLMQPLWGAMLGPQGLAWLSFMVLTFALLLIYELVHLRLMGRINLMMGARLESLGGALGGGLRMGMIGAWFMIMILMMPNFTILHLFCGWESKAGYWLIENSPAINQVCNATYDKSRKDWKDLQAQFSTRRGGDIGELEKKEPPPPPPPPPAPPKKTTPRPMPTPAPASRP